LRATYNELGNRAVDPRKLCLYAETQYSQPGFPYPRFSAHRPIHWVRGHWMDDGQEVLLPALLAYFNFQPAPEEYFCQVSSNGLAAGADNTDAGLRALFELVERDAFMLTWMCQLPVRRVTFNSGLDPALAEVVRQMTAQGIEVELYLINSGIDIPTIVCLGLGDGVRWPAAFVSLATHASPAIAAGKAILELAHVAPYLASIMRTHRIPPTRDEVMSLEDHALYYARRERSGAFDFMRATTDTVALDQIEKPQEPLVAGCVQLLEKAGVRVAVVDVTSPDVALSPFRVARAIGTDMQPIHFGHRLQRLGNPRLKALLAGRGLNPNPHPIA
jgi:ribosomal protein S12 methylthiotransferase accessory factor